MRVHSQQVYLASRDHFSKQICSISTLETCKYGRYVYCVIQVNPTHCGHTSSQQQSLSVGGQAHIARFGFQGGTDVNEM